MPRDPREFITVTSTLMEHPKVEGLSNAAFRALIDTWCWSKRQRTDGFVPDATWQRRYPAKVRAELTNVGLLEVAEGGVQVHDWSEHQQTTVESDELRAKRAAAGAAGGRAKASKRLAIATNMQEQTASKVLASASPLAKQTASKSVAEKSREEEIPPLSPPEGGKPKRRRATSMPDDWKPNRQHLDLARELNVPTAGLAEQFTDHHHAKGSTFIDWDAAFRTWIRNAAKYDRTSNVHPLRPEPARPAYETPEKREPTW